MQKVSTYNKAELGDAMYCFLVCCNTVILGGALDFVRADTRKEWHLTIAVKPLHNIFINAQLLPETHTAFMFITA
jgi:hypothetical protein